MPRQTTRSTPLHRLGLVLIGLAEACHEIRVISRAG